MRQGSRLKKTESLTEAWLNERNRVHRFPRWLATRLLHPSPLDIGLPWMSFEVIEWLSRYLRPNMAVFEFGSGASTIFFGQRVRRLVTVENNPEWFRKVVAAVASHGLSNCECILREPEALDGVRPLYAPGSYTSNKSEFERNTFKKYVESIDAFPDRSFDLIVVDGRSRASCVMHSISKVRNGGYLLLDDSHRSQYLSSTLLLRSFPRQDLVGLSPYTRGDLHYTSIWRIATPTDPT